ncbi:MAG: CNNM domain-containing protein [candidate division WOR-3 bacterium]
MELLAAVLLIVLLGVFAGSETAVYRANWIRLTNWVRRRISGAAAALRMLDNRESAIITTLVGTNLCAVFSTQIASRFFAEDLGPAFTPLAVALVVVLTLVAGEYLPKALAQAVPDRWLRTFSLPLQASRILFAPFVYLLAGLVRLLGPRDASRRSFALTRQDFVTALATPASAALARRLFRFSGSPVADIAIPIEQVRSVRHDAGLNEITTLVAETGFSRIPVWEGTPDNITGVIVVKDLLAAPARRVRRVQRVPATARSLEVLRQMQQRGDHMVALHDAAGRTTGIVTLEDLLEELVGEIRSEA